MSRYALVSRSEPLSVENDGEVAVKKGSVQEELSSIYESYAELYPNTRLAGEFRARDQLLAQATAIQARRKRKAAPEQSSQKPCGGIARFLRFWSRTETDTGESSGATDPSLSEDEVLIYSDEPETGNDVSLCGTQGQLDSRCIPQEAHSAARFHLASVRSQRDRPILVRKANDFSSAPSGALVIIGIGRIAEFIENPSEQQQTPSLKDSEPLVPVVKETSDRADLVSYISSLQTPFDLSHVRASSLGPNFIAISWGFLDGIVVMYRRMAMPNFPEVGWESVAMFGPTRATLDTLRGTGDLFTEDSNGQVLSSLLRVTDMVPLVGEYPSNETESSPIPAATLAVSRLGGCLELVPLTPRLWYGPVLTPENHKHKPRQTRKRKRRSNEPPEHYCIGKLFNLASDDRAIVSLSTSDHHVDLISMDAYHVQSTDQSPSPVFLLAACGTREGCEIVTFWGVQTVFSGGQSGFELRVVLIDRIDIGSAGADVTIFAGEQIWKQWRRPRRVRLRRLAHDEGNGCDQKQGENDGSSCSADGVAGSLTAKHQTGTLSTPAPTCCLRFGDVAPYPDEKIHSQQPGRCKSKLMLAALDWNGGVTIIDCHGVWQAAFGLRSIEQRNANHRQDGHEDSLFGRCNFLLHRKDTWEPSLQTSKNIGRSTVDVRWWEAAGTGNGVRKPCLAMVTASGQLQVLDVSAPMPGTSTPTCVLDLSSILQDAASLAIVDSTESESLSLLLDRRGQTDTDGQGESEVNAVGELSLCAIQRLDAAVIVQSLARSGRYSEALAAVDSLSGEQKAALADVVNFCHRFLWETDVDANHLGKVTDDEYVLKEAVSIFNEDGSRSQNLDVESARKAAMIGVKRASEMENSASRHAKHPGWTNGELAETGIDAIGLTRETHTKLMDSLVRLGTYQLLGRNLGNHLSFARFRTNFLNLSPVELAVSFAKKGDISAVSILFIRHWNEILPRILDVLDHIPITAPVSSYCHLLPLGRSEGETEDDFMPLESEVRLPWSQAAQYLGKRSGLNVFLDHDDRETVVNLSLLGRSKKSRISSDEDETNDIGQWYLRRAQHIQSSLGDLSAVVEFCDFALRRLADPPSSGFSETVGAVESSNVSLSLRSLLAFRACAFHLNQILDDGVLFAADHLLPYDASITMSTDDLRKMDLPDLVSMILGETTDSLEIFSKYRDFLRPLVNIPDFTEVTSNQGVGMDGAIASYCLRLIHVALQNSHVASVDGDLTMFRAHALLEGLAVSMTIASASRTTIRKCDRLIQDKKVLVDLVVAAVYDTVQNIREKPLSPPECRRIIDLMWEMYECLPKHVSELEEADDSVKSMQERMDSLYCHLVALDLLSQWVQHRAFSLVIEMRSSWDGNDTKSDGGDSTEMWSKIGPVGLTIVSEMCRGFCQLAAKGSDPRPDQLPPSLFRDFFDDVNELNRICFRGALECEEVLSTELPRQLLEREQFHLLVEMLNSGRSDWLNRKELQMALSSYVNEAMFSGGDGVAIDVNRMRAAIQSQDNLGPLFPELRAEFQSMRRYLDAASFIANVLNSGQEKSVLHPRDIRDRLPLDVVETVLRENPRSVIAGCNEWEDASFSRKANAAICQHFGGSSVVSNSLPPLPGGAIFHLAEILGLDSLSSQLIVKSRVAHHAFKAKLFGASSAMCMSLVCDPSLPWNGDPDVTVRLDVVAQVVSADNYDDVQTKKELCTAVLLRCPVKLSVCDTRSFDVIILSSSLLESQMMQRSVQGEVGLASGPGVATENNVSTMTHAGAKEMQQAGSPRSDFLVFRAADIFSKTAQTLAGVPVTSAEGLCGQRGAMFGSLRPNDRLYRYILTHYATDMHELFSELHRHLLCETDKPLDPILYTICRLVMFWCISDSMRFGGTDPQGHVEEADARAVLAFGTSLLLHIREKESGLSLVKELQTTADTEFSKMQEQVAATHFPSDVLPDADITSRLLGRGYSENGARRAAVMVKNESYDSALVWAVSHSLDSNFDDPLVVVKSDNDATQFVDQKTVQRIKKALQVACDVLEGKESMSRIRASDDSVVTMAKTVAMVLETQATKPRASYVPGSPSGRRSPESVLVPEHGTTTTVAPRAVPPPPVGRANGTGRRPSKLAVAARAKAKDPPSAQSSARPGSAMGRSTGTIETNDVGPSRNGMQSPSVSALTKKSSLRTQPKPALGSNGHSQKKTRAGGPPLNTASIAPPPPRTPRDTPKEQLQQTSGAEWADGGGSCASHLENKSSAFPADTPPAVESVDRSVLRQLGERARKEMSNEVASLTPDERQRLLDEGRRLLQKSKGPAVESSAQAGTAGGDEPSSQRHGQSSSQSASKAAPVAAHTRNLELDDVEQESGPDEDAWDFDEDFEI